MTWPIPPLPTDLAPTDPQLDDHPAWHDAIVDAISELQTRNRTGDARLWVATGDLTDQALPTGVMWSHSFTPTTSGLAIITSQDHLVHPAGNASALSVKLALDVAGAREVHLQHDWRPQTHFALPSSLTFRRHTFTMRAVVPVTAGVPVTVEGNCTNNYFSSQWRPGMHMAMAWVLEGQLA